MANSHKQKANAKLVASLRSAANSATSQEKALKKLFVIFAGQILSLLKTLLLFANSHICNLLGHYRLEFTLGRTNRCHVPNGLVLLLPCWLKVRAMRKWHGCITDEHP